MVTPSQSDLKEMVCNHVEIEVEWHLCKCRVKHSLVHPFHHTRSIFQRHFISNMEVLRDDLCFILDLEGFFPYGKFFHVREMGCYTWNQEHGRHTFFIPIPYIQGFERQRQKHLPFRVQQDPRALLPTHLSRTCSPSNAAKIIGQEPVSKVQDRHKNRSRVQRRSRGKRLITKTEHTLSQSRNSGLPQIRCIENSFSQRIITTQLWISQLKTTTKFITVP